MRSAHRLMRPHGTAHSAHFEDASRYGFPARQREHGRELHTRALCGRCRTPRMLVSSQRLEGTMPQVPFGTPTSSPHSRRRTPLAQSVPLLSQSSPSAGRFAREDSASRRVSISRADVESSPLRRCARCRTVNAALDAAAHTTPCHGRRLSSPITAASYLAAASALLLWSLLQPRGGYLVPRLVPPPEPAC